MSLQDMQDKKVEINLAGQKFNAHQLFIDDWAQVERELSGEKIGINGILGGEVSIIGYRAIVKVAIKQDLPRQTSIPDLFIAVGKILNLETLPGEGFPNDQEAPG